MRNSRVVGVLAAAAAGALLAFAPPAAATTPSTTALTSSVNPSAPGQAVTLTATVSGTAPTGQVAFADQGAPLGSVDLVSGAATLVVSSLTAGGHALTATYAGDTGNDGSVGTFSQQVVAPPAPPAPVVTVKPPKVKLVASTTKTSVGDKVRLRWHSKNADSVTASGAWRGAQKPHGSAAIRINERGKHVFKLTVRNAVGVKTTKVTVLASRKAKTLDLVVTDELTMVGSTVTVSADGLAKAEDYTVRLAGKMILTGKANAKGDVARTFTLAKSTPEGALPLTITGSNPSRVGTGVLDVIKPKTLDVEVATPKIERKEQQTLTVTGLFPGETVTVTYLGKKLTSGTADHDGRFTYDFGVGKETGQRTVKVVGADPSRVGTVTFTVDGPDGGPTGPPTPGRTGDGPTRWGRERAA